MISVARSAHTTTASARSASDGQRTEMGQKAETCQSRMLVSGSVSQQLGAQAFSPLSMYPVHTHKPFGNVWPESVFSFLRVELI